MNKKAEVRNVLQSKIIQSINHFLKNPCKTRLKLFMHTAFRAAEYKDNSRSCNLSMIWSSYPGTLCEICPLSADRNQLESKALCANLCDHYFEQKRMDIEKWLPSMISILIEIKALLESHEYEY